MWFNFGKGTSFKDIYEQTSKILNVIQKEDVSLKISRVGWRNLFVYALGRISNTQLFEYQNLSIGAFTSTRERNFGKDKMGLRFDVTTATHRENKKMGLLIDTDVFLNGNKDSTRQLRRIYEYYNSQFSIDVAPITNVVKMEEDGK